MTVVNYTYLVDKESGNPLQMLIDENGIDRKKYPLLLSAGDKSTMSYSHVLAVIKKQELPPSQLVGLDQASLPPMIRHIDDIFRAKLGEYKESLVEAIRKDLKLCREYDVKLEEQFDRKNYTMICTLWGLLFLGVGAIPGLIIGLTKDKAKNERNATNTTLTRYEESGNRRAWMKEVDILEKKRVQEINTLLMMRMKTLYKSLRMSLKDKEWNIEYVKELRSCFLVYKAVIPGAKDTFDTIEEKNINVAEFLKQFDSKK